MPSALFDNHAEACMPAYQREGRKYSYLHENAAGEAVWQIWFGIK